MWLRGLKEVLITRALVYSNILSLVFKPVVVITVSGICLLASNECCKRNKAYLPIEFQLICYPIYIPEMEKIMTSGAEK